MMQEYSQNPENFYPAAQSWSRRVPSPPRLNVPPTLDLKNSPGITVAPGEEYDFASTGFSNTDFLSAFTYADCITGQEIHDWKYTNRWDAQRILPFLYLGPVSAARSRAFLEGNGITMVLAVRDTKTAAARLLASNVAAEMNLAYATVDTAGNQELIAAFPRGIDTINAHLSAVYHQSQGRDPAASPGRVLVFCESGNTRSAAMVVAYIMAMFSMSVIRAILLVQSQRFAVAFDEDTKLMLQTYDSILSAKREVLHTARQDSGGQSNGSLAEHMSTSNVSRKPSKRTLDDSDDAMDCDGDGGINGRQTDEKREGAAPFRDDAGY
ncbi:MAG: hypothetical protein LQ345_003891 [Seirophora villosa]|nr:MAG: hypothetical protein LQ345_003891 [Seirophora villosa]